MWIHLDSELERQIDGMAKESGRTLEQVLVERVTRGLEKTKGDGAATCVEAQRKAIEALCNEIDRLPLRNTDDGLSAVDHEKDIYRRAW